MPELRAETTKSLLVATQKGKTNILAGSQHTHDDKIIERMFLSSQPEAIKSVHSGNTLEDLVSVDKTLTESQRETSRRIHLGQGIFYRHQILLTSAVQSC